jgi:hypothetical protein
MLKYIARSLVGEEGLLLTGWMAVNISTNGFKRREAAGQIRSGFGVPFGLIC